MALPVLTKTWQFNTNQIIPDGGSSSVINRTAMLLFKNNLKAFGAPYVVTGSGNGTTGALDAVDRWSTIADLVAGGSGNGAWITLRQTGIGPNFDILIGVDNVFGDDSRGYMMASYTGFVTGGTALTRPTATDEYVISTDSAPDGYGSPNFWLPFSATQFRLNVWHASDGSATYWQHYHTDIPSNCGMIMKPLLPASGFTEPALAATTTGGNGLGTLIASNSLFTFVSGVRHLCQATTEGTINGAPLYSNAGGQLSTLNSSYILSPLGFVALIGTPNIEHGRWGSLVDAWIGSQSLGDVTTFPNDSSRQFIMIKGAANMVLPWDGSLIQTS